MTDTFSPEEFADYWESHINDEEISIDFMASKLVTDEGREELANTATLLARRHGVSSKVVITFRVAMRDACGKAGIDRFSPGKVNGSDKDDDGVRMTIKPARAQSNPRKINHEKKIRKAVEDCLRDENNDLTSTEIMEIVEVAIETYL